MTPSDFIYDLLALSSALDVQLDYLADHVYDAKLRSGCKVLDPTDFKLWLRELAMEVRRREPVRFTADGGRK